MSGSHWLTESAEQVISIKLKCLELVNSFEPDNAFMCGSSLVHVMAWHLCGAKPLPEPMMIYYSFETPELISVNFSLIIFFQNTFEILFAKCWPFCFDLSVLTH